MSDEELRSYGKCGQKYDSCKCKDQEPGKCGQKYDSCKCKDQEPEDDDIEDMFDNDTTPIEESYHKCRKCGEIFKH